VKNRHPASDKGAMRMKLKNVLIVVKDIERSKKFYRDLFGLEMVLDNDGNMILTEGLVLQEEKYWKAFLGRDIIPENNASELYFEEPDIEGFIDRLEKYFPEVKYVNRLMTHSWGQKVIRFYDPDGNLYLQDEKNWERFTGRRIVQQSNQTELYFEEPEIDSFVKKLERLYPDIEYVNRLMTHSWGQRVVRFYDLDGNLIEVGTPV